MLAGVVALILGLWVSVGCRLGVWTWRDYQVYLMVTRGITVGHGLWCGEIQAGDDVDSVVGRSNPQMVHRFGPWTEATYIPGGPRTNAVISLVGVTLLARDQKLVHANFHSCTESRTFFDMMTPEDEESYRNAFSNYVAQLQHTREESAQQSGGEVRD